MSNNERRNLAELTKAANALELVEDFELVAKIRDKSQAIVSLSKRMELAAGIVIEAGLIKVKAERRMGQLLAKLNLDKGGRPKQDEHGNLLQRATGLNLKELGISRTESSRFQQIGKIPQRDFIAYTSAEVEANRPPTTNGVLGVAKRYFAKQRAQKLPKHQGYETDLQQLVDDGKQFATVYADPPWPYRNRSSNGAANNHYPTMSMDDILAEPVKEIAADKSHLHLWVPASFIEEGLAVMKAWGFKYKSYFVWVKKHIGTGNYYRRADELMLFGDRYIGNDQEMLMLGTRGGEVFLDHSIRSWAEYPRREHSQKPEAVREMVEKVSPGPYLEMYSRSKPKRGWTHYGNQIVRS